MRKIRKKVYEGRRLISSEIIEPKKETANEVVKVTEKKKRSEKID